jgi:hypothetical protein
MLRIGFICRPETKGIETLRFDQARESDFVYLPP